MSKRCIYYKKDFFEDLLAKCRAFYELPGCSSGGPLHILLDDNNLTDEDIFFCIDMCGSVENQEVKILGLNICHTYLLMSDYERSAFDWFWNGNDLICRHDKKCAECDICKLED